MREQVHTCLTAAGSLLQKCTYSILETTERTAAELPLTLGNRVRNVWKMKRTDNVTLLVRTGLSDDNTTSAYFIMLKMFFSNFIFLFLKIHLYTKFFYRPLVSAVVPNKINEYKAAYELYVYRCSLFFLLHCVFTDILCFLSKLCACCFPSLFCRYSYKDISSLLAFPNPL